MASIRIGGLRWDLIANVGTFNRNMQQANRIMMQQATVSTRASAVTARNTQVTNAAAAAHGRAAKAAASHAAALGALQTMSVGGAFGGRGGRMVGAGILGSRFGAVGAAGIAGLGTALLAKSAFDTARNFEEMRFDMQTLVGDIDRGNDLFETMFRLSQQTALTMEGAANAARQLLAFGVPADEIERLSDAMADISGGNALRMQRLSLAIGQIFSAGRLFGTERRQLTELGFNPLQQIAARTGESMQELNERMEEGRIGWQEVKQAIEDATSSGGRFFNRSEKRLETMNGTIDLLIGKWQKLADTIGKGALPPAGGATDVLGIGMEELDKAINQIDPRRPFWSIGNFFRAAGGYATRGGGVLNDNKFFGAGFRGLEKLRSGMMEDTFGVKQRSRDQRIAGIQLGLAMSGLAGPNKKALEELGGRLAGAQFDRAMASLDFGGSNLMPVIGPDTPGFIGPQNRTGAARRGAMNAAEVTNLLREQLKNLEEQRDQLEEQNKRLDSGGPAANLGGSFGSREEFAARQAMQQQQRQAEAAEEAFRRAEEQREREITVLEAIDRKMEQIGQGDPVEAI